MYDFLDSSQYANSKTSFSKTVTSCNTTSNCSDKLSTLDINNCRDIVHRKFIESTSVAFFTRPNNSSRMATISECSRSIKIKSLDVKNIVRVFSYCSETEKKYGIKIPLTCLFDEEMEKQITNDDRYKNIRSYENYDLYLEICDALIRKEKTYENYFRHLTVNYEVIMDATKIYDTLWNYIFAFWEIYELIDALGRRYKINLQAVVDLFITKIPNGHGTRIYRRFANKNFESFENFIFNFAVQNEYDYLIFKRKRIAALVVSTATITATPVNTKALNSNSIDTDIRENNAQLTRTIFTDALRVSNVPTIVPVAINNSAPNKIVPSIATVPNTTVAATASTKIICLPALYGECSKNGCSKSHDYKFAANGKIIPTVSDTIVTVSIVPIAASLVTTVMVPLTATVAAVIIPAVAAAAAHTDIVVVEYALSIEAVPVTRVDDRVTESSRVDSLPLSSGPNSIADAIDDALISVSTSTEDTNISTATGCELSLSNTVLPSLDVSSAIQVNAVEVISICSSNDCSLTDEPVMSSVGTLSSNSTHAMPSTTADLASHVCLESAGLILSDSVSEIFSPVSAVSVNSLSTRSTTITINTLVGGGGVVTAVKSASVAALFNAFEFIRVLLFILQCQSLQSLDDIVSSRLFFGIMNRFDRFKWRLRCV